MGDNIGLVINIVLCIFYYCWFVGGVGRGVNVYYLFYWYCEGIEGIVVV